MAKLRTELESMPKPKINAMGGGRASGKGLETASAVGGTNSK